jgi:hypothetical protein
MYNSKFVDASEFHTGAGDSPSSSLAWVEEATCRLASVGRTSVDFGVAGVARRLAGWLRLECFLVYEREYIMYGGWVQEG